jgi:hypothetical protein
MLRLFVLGLGIVLLAAGVLGITLGAGAGMLGPLIFGVLLLIGTVFEPHYKRGQSASANEGFAPTGERFLDPSRGEFVEVWYNDTTGERRYVNGARKAR